MREIQHWLVERVALAKKKRDQQPADAAVAIEERMNRLELSVCEAYFDQQRQVIAFVQERFEVAESFRYFVRRWRNERGVRQRRPSRPNPILTATQLARSQSGSADAMQQLRVNLADEATRDRKLFQPREAVIHRPDVIHDLVDIARRVCLEHLCFRREQILERTLRSFDLAR